MRECKWAGLARPSLVDCAISTKSLKLVISVFPGRLSHDIVWPSVSIIFLLHEYGPWGENMYVTLSFIKTENCKKTKQKRMV